MSKNNNFTQKSLCHSLLLHIEENTRSSSDNPAIVISDILLTEKCLDFYNFYDINLLIKRDLERESKGLTARLLSYTWNVQDDKLITKVLENNRIIINGRANGEIYRNYKRRY